MRRANEVGARAILIVRHGEHGWPNLDDDREAIADWFDANLRDVTKQELREH